ncbi:unnamed protein product [Durusdinium trenchii]|uniref:EF-hand domain-containing protein n=2 Tax=Durusdinium trenchii TaxID=1381693 RepID=A0ABP0H4K1_9DINO
MLGALRDVLVLGVLGATAQSCPRPTEILANLSEDYDSLAHPGQLTGLPVNVSLGLYVASIVAVNQKDQQLILEGYYRSAWTDPRLNISRFNCESLTVPTKSGSFPFWQPDLYFDNSVSEWYGAGGLTIDSKGYVFRSERFKHVFRCPMNFDMLPFDSQTCVVRMSSYAYSSADLALRVFAEGAVELPPDYWGTTEFKLTAAAGEVETLFYGVGENQRGYSFVLISFHLHRMPDSFMMFVFVTCILFTFVSWSGLFINRAVAPARVTIAVIPVLIMLNLENNVISNLPPLNYLTWITSYLLLMKFFCVSAVFEYGLVSFLIQLETARERQFEAFRHLATTVKKKAAEDEASISCERPRPPSWTSPKVYPSAGSAGSTSARKLLQVAPGVAQKEKEDKEPAEEKEKKEDDTEELNLQKKFNKVYRLFDADDSGELSWREVQMGFRKLGQYWSKDQVQELFFSLGIVGHQRMTQADFKRFMMDIQKFLPGKAMNISFFERPPSYQVDVVFRWLYITGVVLVTAGWLLSTMGT